ncbi:LysR family transcriptional regulator [Streptomyces lavendulocolor]|uniref:LysR family transcriptional regulator n=1 Tax=Streptomyces lavendulocolor TaxID=67316 RepID=UPI0031E085A6
MEIHQLRYFAAVMDEGTFTAAAHRLHVSQSGVSTQVAKLEQELGQQLAGGAFRGQAVSRPTDKP